MMRAVALAAAVALSLAACATVAPMERPAPNIAEYLELEGRTGTGVVTGQVFLKTRGGEVRYGAGSAVILNPVTSYSRFWYENGYLQGKRLAPPDAMVEKYLIQTQADGFGNFRFENVPPGDYYLTSSVTWEVPIGQFTTSQQGGFISEPITVRDGEEVRKILTR